MQLRQELEFLLLVELQELALQRQLEQREQPEGE
jgi:hypothetical protein